MENQKPLPVSKDLVTKFPPGSFIGLTPEEADEMKSLGETREQYDGRRFARAVGALVGAMILCAQAKHFFAHYNSPRWVIFCGWRKRPARI